MPLRFVESRLGAQRRSSTRKRAFRPELPMRAKATKSRSLWTYVVASAVLIPA
jgi:hypothetical protein